jgi:predicted nucleic acid-binding Zn ribbon protein
MKPPPFHKIPPLGPPKSNARQKILTAWRGRDTTPDEIAGRSNTKAAGQVLPAVLKHLRLEQRQGEAEIARVWRHLMSPDVVAHSQPTGLHKGTLFVSVDNPAWKDEIVRYRRKEILDRLQHSFGRELIKRISFRIG